MTQKYAYRSLAKKYGFDARQLEKAIRISDLLKDISAVKLTQNCLSLCGGTAINFIYAPKMARLSVDLDFNYRHLGARDWGEVRQEIDKTLKDLIYRQGYEKSDVFIKATYPLARITIEYVNHLDSKDELKIETGYMRRIPILKTDALVAFKHIATQETFNVQTPIKEELFANKWFTMLDRKTSRDLFDVYQITKMEFDRTTFRKCALIESLMQEKQKLTRINTKNTINKIPIDNSLRNLLQTEAVSDYDFQEIKEQVTKLTEETISDITPSEAKALNQFFDHSTFNPSLIDDSGILNEKIDEHPAILRTLQKLRQRKRRRRETRPRRDGFGASKGMTPFTAEDELNTHD